MSSPDSFGSPSAISPCPRQPLVDVEGNAGLGIARKYRPRDIARSEVAGEEEVAGEGGWRRQLTRQGTVARIIAEMIPCRLRYIGECTYRVMWEVFR